MKENKKETRKNGREKEREINIKRYKEKEEKWNNRELNIKQRKKKRKEEKKVKRM